MSIIQSVDMNIDCIIKNNKQMLSHLYVQNENIPEDLNLTEKKNYANAIFDKIEEIEQIIDTLEIIKKKNLGLKESTFCNIDFDGSPININDSKELVIDNELIADFSEEEMYKLKTGVLVRYIIKKLNNDKKLTQIDITNLQNKEWCKEILLVNYPIIKKYNQYLSFSDQRKENGMVKYYSQVYFIGDEKYLLCSELFDRVRQPILMWFNEKYNKKIDYNNESLNNKMENHKSIILVKYDISSLNPLSNKPNKPCKIMINGKVFDVDSWSDTIIKLCENMIAFYPEKMIKIVNEPLFKGTSRSVFSNDPLLLLKPKKLSNGIYVQTTFTSSKILNICYNIVSYCGLNQDRLKIYCYEDEKKISIIEDDNCFSIEDNANESKRLTIEDIDNDFTDEFIRIIDIFQNQD